MVISASNGEFIIERSEILHISNIEPRLDGYLYNLSTRSAVQEYEMSIVLIPDMEIVIRDTEENLKNIKKELI